jgi:arsenite-transporting ATPase
VSAAWHAPLATRHLFFTGKGGVGKTSLACAAAVALAEQGHRTLLVSTDPASNLDEVLGVALGNAPTPVPSVARLFALNIDPEAAARRYRERAVGPYRGILPEAALQRMEEQLSGACTTEIAAFDEFTDLLGGGEVASGFDRIVFDTAPTGHTLRLLSLPAAWTGFIDTNSSGVSCLGPLAALQKQEALYRASVETLRDRASTTLVLVARADAPSLREAARASGELAEIGIRNQHLIVNAVFTPTDPTDPVATALGARSRAALAALPPVLAALPRSEVPLLPRTVVGLEAVRLLASNAPSAIPARKAAISAPGAAGGSLADLVADVERSGHGVVMTMGKGGVGKTSVAVAIATALARRGHPTLLTTTDPAAHVGEAATERPSALQVSRIDPAEEVRRYSESVLASAREWMDPEGLAALEEDLRSPCTEEIAVFRAFAEVVAAGSDRFVVVDTAPTGHTILLLDAAEAYHREVTRTGNETPENVRRLLPRLRDPEFTRVVLVTLPEPTPVHEAAALRDDLARAGIQPFACVANQSLLASGARDPVLAAKSAEEAGPLAEARYLAPRFAVIPWIADPAELLRG